MKVRLYLVLSLLLLSIQYSEGQFLDYNPIPLQNNNSYNFERSDRAFEEMIRQKELEAKQQMEYERRAEIAKRAAQPVVINEELISASGFNLMKEKKVKAKISQMTYSNGDVRFFLTGLKYNEEWIPINHTEISEISTLIRQATYDEEVESKKFLLKLSEIATYITILNDEYIIF